jgi:hypothetical protein
MGAGKMGIHRWRDGSHAQYACLQSAITFCGHMHIPTLYHMTMTGKTGEFLPTPENGIPLSKQRRWLVIPGSAGQPRDGNPAACYATFDTETLELTFTAYPTTMKPPAKILPPAASITGKTTSDRGIVCAHSLQPGMEFDGYRWKKNCIPAAWLRSGASPIYASVMSANRGWKTVCRH